MSAYLSMKKGKELQSGCRMIRLLSFRFKNEIRCQMPNELIDKYVVGVLLDLNLSKKSATKKQIIMCGSTGFCNILWIGFNLM